MISLNHRLVSEAVLFYEHPSSLKFFVEHRDQFGAYVGTIQFSVRASMLRRSLARMARPMPKKRKESK